MSLAVTHTIIDFKYLLLVISYGEPRERKPGKLS